MRSIVDRNVIMRCMTLVNEDESHESCCLSGKWCWNEPAWVHVWHK